MITLLLLSALNFSNLVSPFDVSGIVKAATSSGAMEIAADPAFSNKTYDFAPNQTVYARVSTDNDGADKRNLNVHDNNYNLLSTYQMSRSGSQFTVNFPAPQNQGTYSLEANIASGGSVANFVRTITVGGGGGNVQTKVNVENKINSNSSIDDRPTPVPSLSPVPSPASATSVQKQSLLFSIWSAFVGFFKKLF